MSKLIMTVDDSASIRQMVGFTLRNAGYEVIEAKDGKDAVSKLSGPIKMVITDLNMPNMDGIELIRQIRANAAYKFIPVIMLTTESQATRKPASRKARPPGPRGGSSSRSSRSSCWPWSRRCSARGSFQIVLSPVGFVKLRLPCGRIR